MQQIRNVSEPSQWHHIAGEENPADLASRGMSSSKLIASDKWFAGPGFLRQKDLLLRASPPPEIPPDDPEVKPTATCNLIQTGTSVSCERFLYYFQLAFTQKKRSPSDIVDGAPAEADHEVSGQQVSSRITNCRHYRKGRKGDMAIHSGVGLRGRD